MTTTNHKGVSITEILLQAVEAHKDLILEAERYIWKHPETGYRE